MGNAGSDIIVSRGSNNTLDGGSGEDTVWFRAGDTVRGGAGADTFVIDEIDYKALGFTAVMASILDFNYLEDRLIISPATDEMYYMQLFKGTVDAGLQTVVDSSLNFELAVIKNHDTTLWFAEETAIANIQTVGKLTSGSYVAGDTVIVKVVFTDTVFVKGLPTLEINVDRTVLKAVYSGGGGTDTLLFSATLPVNLTSVAGISVSSGALHTFDGVQISNSEGVILDPNNADLVIDTTPVFTFTKSINFGLQNGVPLNLIEARYTGSGDAFYLFDVNGDGKMSSADRVSYGMLYQLFNSPPGVPPPIQVNGYRVTLPDASKLQAAYNAGFDAPYLLDTHYWSADPGGRSGEHIGVSLYNGTASPFADSSLKLVLFEVLVA